ncbi:MAG: antibiotic biosynthesis monooxygenase family protein [Kangiellaceae bacterium]|jgi:heme-degrading monooxygenase HmoA|nr:antibiotic biosynthesis monooxygenase family protein [Kangiellaceae bacterium]
MIRVIIERHIKPGLYDDYATVIRQAKKQATKKTGFMGGELYTDTNDDNKIVIIAAWANEENWHEWDNSEERKALTAELKDFLVTDEKVTILRSRRA